MEKKEDKDLIVIVKEINTLLKIKDLEPIKNCMLKYLIHFLVLKMLDLTYV
jgi:hypothetical protein